MAIRLVTQVTVDPKTGIRSSRMVEEHFTPDPAKVEAERIANDAFIKEQTDQHDAQMLRKAQEKVVMDKMIEGL
jgi:hypothetical protein